MNLQIGLQNAASNAALSGWTCQVIWGTGNTAVAGTLPGTPNTVAETVANTASNGLCTTTKILYYAGWQLYVKLCHQTTACTSSSPGQQEYVAVVPLPGGTVPFFAGTQAPTTTWTQPFVIYVTPMAGDIAASNTPITFTFQAQNGTAIATSKTCYTNAASSATSGGCFFGSGSYQQQFTITLTNTYTTSSFPFLAGYTDWNSALDYLVQPGLGTLSTNLYLEDKQTAGSNPICTLTTSSPLGFSNAANPTSKQSTVPDVVYVTPSLSSALTINKPNGYFTTSTGVTTIQFTANCATLTTSSHGDTDSFTFNLYTYFSPTFAVGNSGTVDSIAVTQMSQFVITMSS